MRITSTLRSKIFAAALAAGIAAPSAIYMTERTVDFEGISLPVYLDPVGLPTVCVGHMDRSMKLGKVFTEDECVALFISDWKKHEAELDALSRQVSWRSQWQKAVLTDFVLNKGSGNYRTSTLRSDLIAGRHDKACRELTRWVYAQGKVLGGLVKRANDNYKFCMGEVPYEIEVKYSQYLE